MGFCDNGLLSPCNLIRSWYLYKFYMEKEQEESIAQSQFVPYYDLLMIIFSQAVSC